MKDSVIKSEGKNNNKQVIRRSSSHPSRGSIGNILRGLGVAGSLLPSATAKTIIYCQDNAQQLFSGPLTAMPFGNINQTRLFDYNATANNAEQQFIDAYGSMMSCGVSNNATFAPFLDGGAVAVGCNTNCESVDFIYGLVNAVTQSGNKILQESMELFGKILADTCSRCKAEEEESTSFWSKFLEVLYWVLIGVAGVTILVQGVLFCYDLHAQNLRRRLRRILAQPNAEQNAVGDGGLAVDNELQENVGISADDNASAASSETPWALLQFPGFELTEFSDAMQQYIRSFIGKQKNLEQRERLTETGKTLLDADKYCCAISKDLPNIPVEYNDHIYDLYALIHNARREGDYFVDPMSPSFRFRLNELSVERNLQHEIEDIINENKPVETHSNASP